MVNAADQLEEKITKARLTDEVTRAMTAKFAYAKRKESKLASLAKDVKTLRDCFVEHGALIDYGPLGRFEGREALVAVFEELGCQPGVVDTHHAANAEIEVLDATHARARWALYFFTMIEGMKTVRQLAGHYEDTYECCDDGVWRMQTSVFRAHSILDGDVADDGQITWFPGGKQDAHPS